MGHVFSVPAEETTAQATMLCLGATGNAIGPNVHGQARAYSFFDLKGDIEALLAAFEIRDLRFEQVEHYHPGRSARAVADGITVAEFGQVHPNLTTARKLKQDIYIAEIYLDRLLQLPLRSPRYQPISKYPAVDRDFSFTFADSVSFAQMQSAARMLNIAELQSFQPAETFRGGTVPAGKYSVLLHVQ